MKLSRDKKLGTNQVVLIGIYPVLLTKYDISLSKQKFMLIWEDSTKHFHLNT